MRLRVSHGWKSAFDATEKWKHFLLLSAERGELRFNLQVRLDTDAPAKFAPGWDGRLVDEGLNVITDAVVLAVIERLATMGEDGVVQHLVMIGSTPTLILEFSEADGSEAAQSFAVKHCTLQVRDDDGDLLCKRAMRAANQEVRRLPTTRHNCLLCAMPDRRIACSDFTHAVAGHGPGSFRVQMAQCQRGREEIRTNAGGCRPRGNECWARDIEFESPPDVVLSPLTLHELFEFLDARWRAVFREHLVATRRGIAFGKLATPCTSGSDLDEKLSALANVMKGLEVRDELLKEEHVSNENYKSGRTFARIESALERALADDGDALASAKAAVRVLRNANDLRNNAQHGGRELVEAYARFGLSYPPPAAAKTWARIQARVAKALSELADAMGDL